jgi:hypothetical protein
MRYLIDTVWQRRGTSWIWDEEARNQVCTAGEVWSLRQFLRAVGDWPDDLPSNDNNTLVVAGLEGCLDRGRRDLAGRCHQRRHPVVPVPKSNWRPPCPTRARRGRWCSICSRILKASAWTTTNPFPTSHRACNGWFGSCPRRSWIGGTGWSRSTTRPTRVERQCDAWLHATAASAAFQPDERIDLFRHTVEPTLQRELRHKGAANGDGSYSAELIGYVEIRGQPEGPER